MSYQVYETKLLNHRIFQDIKDSFSDVPSNKLRNLIELRDEVLYIWNSAENCLFALNVKHLDEHDGDTPYQKLHLVKAPAFSVERMMSSACGSRLCLWGSRGVTILHLPSRWGRSGLFDSGNKTILCKSMSLDERFLYLQCDIQRVHWHPKSLSHVLVLVSDNTIRLYNIAMKIGPKLVKVFSVGRRPSGALSRSVLESLGDTAVDFTPTPDSNDLLILTGNGDVYMLKCDLKAKGVLTSELQGPLAMFPAADDNYGAESCGILAVGGADTPTLVVIASASAILYHCLLLVAPAEDKENKYVLHVVESVELDVARSSDHAQTQTSYPVHLYAGPRDAYTCVHASGVHAVQLPLMHDLRAYANTPEHEIDAVLSSIFSKVSSARHLVCTSGNAGSPPVGLAVSPAPLHSLLILCNSGELLTRTLEPYELEERLYKELQLRNPALERHEIDNILKEPTNEKVGRKAPQKQKLSFTAIMQNVLEREVSQPLLKLDKKEQLNPKECLEMVTQATLKLRNEYMARQMLGLDLFAKKVDALRTLGEQQDEWVKDLEKQIKTVEMKAEELRKRRAFAEKFKEDMKFRCCAVFRRLRSREPSGDDERRVLDELRQYAVTVRELQQAMGQLKHSSDARDAEVQNWRDEYQKKPTVLGRSHSETISSILQQQTKQISTLIEETKLLKDQLGIA